jgi:hypothetical protein
MDSHTKRLLDMLLTRLSSFREQHRSLNKYQLFFDREESVAEINGFVEQMAGSFEGPHSDDISDELYRLAGQLDHIRHMSQPEEMIQKVLCQIDATENFLKGLRLKDE